jgi:outer membrane protein assembly factor BamB/tetratricopeptide (TPR) repeat protein/TolA-binding protein
MNGRGPRNVLRRVRRLLLLLALAPAGPAAADGEVRLLTDDAIPRYLSRGQELAKAEQWDKVVDVLHRVVIGDPEVFPDVKDEVLESAVYSEDGRTFYPARELCLLELARLPPEGLRAYRDVHDATARQLLAAADATPEVEDRLAAYAKVHDSYLPSSVGDDALERALDLNLALGRFYEALALARRLIDVYPKDTDRDLPLAFAKAAYCAARIGDTEQVTVLLGRLASEHEGATVKVEGKPVPAAELKDHPFFRRGAGERHADADWPVAGGNPARNRTSPDLPEDLPKKPFWSFLLSERDTRLTVCRSPDPNQGDVWMVLRHDRQPSPLPELRVAAREHVAPYPTAFPIVHGGVLLYKDGRDVVARRGGSGSFVHVAEVVVWWPPATDDPVYRCPLESVRPGTQEAVKDSRVLEAVYEHLDYGAARLVVSGDMILATDWLGAPNELRGEAAAIPNQPNTVIAHSRTSGKQIWAWHGDYPSEAVRADPGVLDAWQKDYQLHRGAAFLGPGVASGGTLYTVASEREGAESGLVSLWAIDAATGRVRFRTMLHYEDEVNRHLPRGAAVAVAGGTVYAVTQAGVVAAVDALPPGHVKWLTRYARGFEGAQGGRRGFRAGRIKQGFAFNDPVVAEGKVFVAPADANEVLALDAESGRVAWSIPKRAVLSASYVLGVKDGLLYLGGDKVFAIDIRKGEITWSSPLRAFRYGRGFVGERYVHVPTRHENSQRSEVERFDLKTGIPADPLVFEVERLGNLLSFDGRLIAANGREIMCFTTYEAEAARVDAALNRPGADRAALLLERGLLALTGATKRRDQAREDLAKAVEAATGDATHLARRYALENLFAIARERNDLLALDEAERIVAPLRGEQGGALGPHPYDAQIALLRAEALGRLAKGEEALAALERFVDEFGHLRVERDGRVVDGTAAGGALRDQLRSESPAFAAAFAETVRGRIEAAVARKDADGLKAILDRYGDEPPAEEARFALADLYEEAGRAEDAEAELRDFARKHQEHPRVAAAHLRLARFYARETKTEAARRERFEAVSRLDEAGRREHAALVAEIDKLLAAGKAATPPVPLRFPLAAAAMAIEGAVPVAVEGGLPDGLAIFATAAEYMAVDATGKIRWSVPNPSRTGISPGPPGEPTTAAVAGAVAAARLAVRRGDDVVLGDVAGLMRVHATSGEVLWRYPPNDAVAREQGQAAIDLLRKDLRDAAAKGFAVRAHPLPSYHLAESVVVRVHPHPRAGVEAIHAGTGDVVWLGEDTQGLVAAGPPAAFGDFVVVGFSRPGWFRVYQAADGAKVCTWRRDEKTVLLAAPVVDRLGRVFVASSQEAEGGNGQLEILDIRSPDTRRRLPLSTGYAAPLFADGRVLVYHDGSSGTENLHFVDLEGGRQEARRGPDLLRAYHVLEAEPRLFVLTSNPGLEDEGGRLFRIDPKAADVLAYDYAVRATAFARPLLTEHHVAVAAILARGAHVRLFDRDASAASRGAQSLFVDPSGKETADMDFRTAGATRLDAGIGIAATDDGLVVGHPWGAVRFVPPAKGGG